MTGTDESIDLLEQTLRQLGLEVTQTHGDLVFVSHNQFILKQTDTPHMIELYFNEDLDEDVAEALMSRLESAGLENSLLISYQGAYSLSENEDQTLSVAFFDLSAD